MVSGDGVGPWFMLFWILFGLVGGLHSGTTTYVLVANDECATTIMVI